MGTITMKPKYAARYSTIVNPFQVACDDSREFVETAKTFYAAHDTFYGSLKKKKVVIKTDAKEIIVAIGEQGFSVEFAEQLKIVAEVSNRFIKMGFDGRAIVNDLTAFGETFNRTKDRINLQRLTDAHVTKLFNNLETESLKLQANYCDFKLNFESVYNEFMEMKKGFDVFLNTDLEE